MIERNSVRHKIVFRNQILNKKLINRILSNCETWNKV